MYKTSQYKKLYAQQESIPFQLPFSSSNSIDKPVKSNSPANQPNRVNYNNQPRKISLLDDFIKEKIQEDVVIRSYVNINEDFFEKLKTLQNQKLFVMKFFNKIQEIKLYPELNNRISNTINQLNSTNFVLPNIVNSLSDILKEVKERYFLMSSNLQQASNFSLTQYKVDNNLENTYVTIEGRNFPINEVNSVSKLKDKFPEKTNEELIELLEFSQISDN